MVCVCVSPPPGHDLHISHVSHRQEHGVKEKEVSYLVNSELIMLKGQIREAGFCFVDFFLTERAR